MIKPLAEGKLHDCIAELKNESMDSWPGAIMAYWMGDWTNGLFVGEMASWIDS